MATTTEHSPGRSWREARAGETFAGEESSVCTAVSWHFYQQSAPALSGAASRVPHSLDQPSDPPQRHPRWAHLQPRHSPEPLSSRRLLTAPQSPWAARLRTVRSDLSSRLCSARVQAAQATLLCPDRHLDVYLLNACHVPGSGARRQTGPGGGLPTRPPSASDASSRRLPLHLPLLPTSGLRQSCAGRQGPSPVLAERSPPLSGLQPPLE